VQLVLLGNKSDLEESRQVRFEEVEEVCRSKGITFMEVSAKSGEHVAQAFEKLAEMLMKIYPKEEQRNEPMAVVEDIRKKRREFQLQAGQKEIKKKGGCC
jgi:GTPase SAR1 family protein